MQVSFHSEANLEKNVTLSSALNTNGLKNNLNFKNSQQVLRSHKNENENYGHSRVYSPYLAPSSAFVYYIQENTKFFQPNYVHNVQLTKYYNISKSVKPQDHHKVNIFA
jgi:hypothetical protein